MPLWRQNSPKAACRWGARLGAEHSATDKGDSGSAVPAVSDAQGLRLPLVFSYEKLDIWLCRSPHRSSDISQPCNTVSSRLCTVPGAPSDPGTLKSWQCWWQLWDALGVHLHEDTRPRQWHWVPWEGKKPSHLHWWPWHSFSTSCWRYPSAFPQTRSCSPAGSFARRNFPGQRNRGFNHSMVKALDRRLALVSLCHMCHLTHRAAQNSITIWFQLPSPFCDYKE